MVETTSADSDRWWRLRAAGRGLLRGAAFAGVVWMVPLVIAATLTFIDWQRGSFDQGAQWLAAAMIVCSVCGVVSAVLFAIAALLSSRPAGKNEVRGPEFRPRGSGARSFDDSLSHYLADATSSNSQRASTSSSRMRFFSLRLPEGRHGPRSTSYFREILGRIHRLLSGG